MTFSKWLLSFYTSFLLGIVGIDAYKMDIRMMRSVYVCQNKTIKLKCERPKVLEIGAADYGREEDSICKKDRKSDEACKLVDKTEAVKSLCNNRRRCKMKVSSSIFGDPCAGLNPYLNIMYVCVQNRCSLTSATTLTTKLTEGKSAHTEGSTATQSILHGPKTIISPRAKFQLISEGIKTAQSSNIDSPTPAQIKQSSTAEPSSTAITADVPTSSANSWTTKAQMKLPVSSELTSTTPTNKCSTATHRKRSDVASANTTKPPETVESSGTNTTTEGMIATHKRRGNISAMGNITGLPATSEPTNTQRTPKQRQDNKLQSNMSKRDPSNSIIVESLSGSANQPSCTFGSYFLSWTCLCSLVVFWLQL
ncbi:Adhesion G protein-coupled receptor L2 [Acropora cervicornis]|uniref:Adhesion G protein-coupled receptor L2 n=1 Tax=Acropora cervicornis TaxID=6130 RepID=A0AAD9QAK5_ACRCE|nr:Adhesion G protein-coupled receptor L2 [Acropora cervicornis]